MRSQRWGLLCFVCGLMGLACWGTPALGQGEEGEPPPFEVTADRLEYDTERRVLQATGNVVVRRGDETLRAEYAEVHRETQDVYARGNVELERAGDVWRGEELTYNFITKQGDFGRFEAFSDPYIVTAEDSQRVSGEDIVLEETTLTPCSDCPPDSPEFLIKAKSARITNGTTLRAKHVLFFIGPVPVFYLPYVKRDLESSNFDFVPGYSSEMGAFLLSAYNYRLNPVLRGTTHLDYRSKRGVGLGQDLFWKNPEKQYEGQLLTYYIDDDEPFDDSQEEMERGDLVDEERFRLRLSHFQVLSDRAWGTAEINYESDPDIREDFFDDEFRLISQPENRVSVTHREDWWSATLLASWEPHDFFEGLQRLPEASLDVNRTRILDTPLFYEGAHSAVYLERVFPSELPEGQTERDDFDSFRFDTFSTILWPTRHFDFLNVIPRVGYRGTAYSDTREEETFTEEVVEIDEMTGVAVTNTVTTVETEDGDGDLRNLVELGLETRFKAFRVLHNDPLGWGHFRGLRHIAEPFANYTYVNDPDVGPEDLFQFDAIDGLDKRNDIFFGVRNKLQTKRGERLHDLIDLNAFTSVRLDPEDNQNDFGNLELDGELRLHRRFPIDFDASINYEENNLDEFNTSFAYLAPDASRIGVEQRFVDASDRNLLTGEVILFPRSKWSFEGHWRYEFETSELEEQEYLVKTKTCCFGLGLGFREVERIGEDDRQVWLQVWLLSFPESEISLGR